jgi:hypothetical protein
MSNKSQVQLTNLHNLIRNAENPDIQTFDQLCKALFGGKRCTWHAFERVMYWMKYSKRSDGSIYKSARELANETQCSTKSIDRTIPALKAAGLDIYIKKANGAPTRHFRVDAKRMIKRLAEVFGHTFEDTCTLMEIDSDIFSRKKGDKSLDQSVSNVSEDQPKKSETVTRTTDRKNSTKETHAFSSFLQMLEARKWCSELDTKPETIEIWVKTYGFDMVASTILQARKKQDEGKIKKSVFGWVNATLKAKYKNEVYNW